MSAPKLRVGILGAGWPGQRHAEGFAASGAWDVIAVADGDPLRRDALAQASRADPVANAEALFARDDLDAVVIALPTYLHHPMVSAALAAGQHVLCEKPPALNAVEAQAMADAARRHGRVLGFCMQRRAMSSSIAALALIERGELGEIYHARAVFTRSWGAPRGAGGWFRDPARAGGGPLIDIGIHVLDLAWYLMGRPQPVGVFGAVHERSTATSPVESSAFGLLRFAGGRSIQLEAAWVLPQSEDALSVQLCGAKAGALIEQGKLTVTRVSAAGVEEQRPPVLIGGPEAYVGPFQIQASRFAAAIRGADANLASAEDGIRLMEMIDALYASGKEQREIRFG